MDDPISKLDISTKQKQSKISLMIYNLSTGQAWR